MLEKKRETSEISTDMRYGNLFGKQEKANFYSQLSSLQGTGVRLRQTAPRAKRRFDAIVLRNFQEETQTETKENLKVKFFLTVSRRCSNLNI